MADIIAIAVLLILIGAAAWYVHRERRRGAKCIGCPSGCSCSSKARGSCRGCGHHGHSEHAA